MAVRLGAAGIALAAAGLLVAACGSSGPTPTPVAQTGFQAYLTCLSQHGVNVPTGQGSPGARPSGRPSARPSGSPRPSASPGASRGGGFGGGGFGGGGFLGTQAPNGVDQATWDKAMAACSSLRPTAGPSGSGRGNNSAFVAYRNCLSEHGVNITNGQNQLNTADPTVAAALQTCAPLRPTGGPGAPGAPSSTSAG
jgi:hypothetical protein